MLSNPVDVTMLLIGSFFIPSPRFSTKGKPRTCVSINVAMNYEQQKRSSLPLVGSSTRRGFEDHQIISEKIKKRLVYTKEWADAR